MTQTIPKITRLHKPAKADSFGIANSPIGYLLAAWQDDLLVQLRLLPAHAEKDLADVISDCGLMQSTRDDSRARELVTTNLFTGTDWRQASLDQVQIGYHGTDFQWSVLNHMAAIPFGQTTHYAGLAKLAGAPKASRAAGSVCARNPVPFVIPCHRVLTSTGKIGNYAYGTALKRQLLQWETS